MKAGGSRGLQGPDPWETLWYSPEAGASAARLALVPLSVLFGVGAAARSALYERGLLETVAASAPVVSVGSLRVGGAGKTPFVLWLAGRLRQQGLGPCIVTRGYGGARQDGDEPFLLDATGAAAPDMVARAGDEAVLLARRSGVPVVVGGDRVRACAAASAALDTAPDVFVLDDGFQHRRLARDLDIVLVTGAEDGERQLPAGPLRESVASLERAGVIVQLGDGGERRPGGGVPASAAGPPRMRAHRLVSSVVARVEDEEGDDPSSLAGSRVVAVAAVARPERFLADLRATGAEVVATVLRRDHHRFDEADRLVVEAEAGQADFVVTTEKDLVKLEHLFAPTPSAARLRALRIDLAFDDPAGEQALFAAVRAALDR